MRMDAPSTGPRGSFGLPKEMREELEARQEAANAPSKKVMEEKAVEPVDFWSEGDPVESKELKEVQKEAQAQVDKVNPFNILKELGIQAKEEDFHSLIFKGFVEKVVPIANNPLGGQGLEAKIKTLTAEEYDFVDELVSDDIDKLKLTNNGVDIRRTMWTLAFAILELNGKPVSTPVYDESKTYNAKETAKKKRLVLSKLSPYVLNKITDIHARMSSSFVLLITNPEYKVLKK